MTTLVIDASVAIKWVIDEPGADQALALRRMRCQAPDLLTAECANILWKKVRRRELTHEEARLAGQLLMQAGVGLVAMSTLMEPALALAIALDHAAYDCIYLALASRLGCPLVTADRKLCQKVRANDPAAHILDLDQAEASLTRLP